MISNPRWQEWLGMLRSSDATLVTIATMAACAVLLWESMRRLPEPLGGWLRSAYLVALAMFVLWSLNYTSTTQDIALIAGAAVVWIGAQRWFRSLQK